MRAILLFAILPTMAAAQTTNTTCLVNGQWVTCNSRQQQPIDTKPTDFIAGLGGYDNLPNPARESQDARAAYATSHRQQVLRTLSDLIASHRCDEAKALAIREGGLSAGQQVADLCK